MNTTVSDTASPHHPRPRVLFVGEPDQAQPELAADLLRSAAGDLVEVETAGTHAGGPTPTLSASALRRADRVVSLGRGVDVARLAGPRYETWETAETPAVTDETARQVLQQQVLAQRVEALAADLTAVTVITADPTLSGRVRTLLERLARR